MAELKMVKFDFIVSLMGPNPMHVLLYNQLKSGNIPGFAKLKKYLEADDFYSAEVKKIGDNLYRARLNAADRLLFAIYRYQAIFAHPLEYAVLSIFGDMRSSGIWKVANGGSEQHGAFGSKLLSIF